MARTRFVAGVTATILTFAPGVPNPLRFLAFEPYITLVNIMACRVYRRTRAGVICEPEIPTAAPNIHPIVFAGEAAYSLVSSLPHADSYGSDISFKVERSSTV